jgi:hypothetical protein
MCKVFILKALFLKVLILNRLALPLAQLRTGKLWMMAQTGEQQLNLAIDLIIRDAT